MKHIFRNTAVALLVGICSFTASAQEGLKVGQYAPQFKTTDDKGKPIELRQLLKTNKAVVLFFYRGQWCPYCNKYISQMQDSLQLLVAKGAYVVGVTPETVENIEKTKQKTKSAFSMIHDDGNKIMKDYDVAYTVDEATQTALKKYGIDVDKNNGNSDHTLPVPATYIVGKDGKIAYVQFNKDYTQRASVKALLDQL